MADPHDTTPRPVQNWSPIEFRTLCHERDVAAYFCVGVAIEALAFMNMGDADRAYNVLMQAVERYNTADRAIDQFRKENFSNGNAAA